MIWLISDTHFSHFNIIRYCNRPYQTTDEMDEDMIAKWNSVVKPNDTVVHGGDFAWKGKDQAKAICLRLNGRKILVHGNHDKSKSTMIEIGFEEVLPFWKMEDVILVHDPASFQAIPSEVLGCKYFLYGHTHNIPIVKEGSKSICVEMINYTPISLEEIRR